MKSRGALFFVVMGVALASALSTGGRLYLLMFLVMAVMALLSLISVIWVSWSLDAVCSVSSSRTTRGGTVDVVVAMRHTCILPIAPVQLSMNAPDAGPQLEVRVNAPAFVRTTCRQPFPCPHVGLYRAGLGCLTLSDVFGLFTVRRVPLNREHGLVVLPEVGQAKPLAFSPGEQESAVMARATEDTNQPADVRAYQEGDPLKRIHWKLSQRKREILIKRYEEPARPDALILMNCAPPSDDLELAHTLRDVLCETAASLVAAQLTLGHPVRMPLIGERAREVSCDKAQELPGVLEALAETPFDGTDRFERVLMLEMRRLRRTGATVVITSRLDARSADMILRIRRAGPYTRVYFVYTGALPEEADDLLNKLEQHDIHVETIALVHGEDSQDEGGDEVAVQT